MPGPPSAHRRQRLHLAVKTTQENGPAPTHSLRMVHSIEAALRPVVCHKSRGGVCLDQTPAKCFRECRGLIVVIEQHPYHHTRIKVKIGKCRWLELLLVEPIPYLL